jgi:microcompartment protein CcmL/EutN
MAIKALGMIETKGLVALIEAADAMAKAAAVRLLTRENVDSGLVTIMCEGELGAVKAAVEAGAEAARRVGTVATVHIIPRPHEDLQEQVEKLPQQGPPYRAPQGHRLSR